MNDEFLLKNRNIRSKNQESRPLTLDDLLLHRVIHKGTTMIRDTTCDSEYMLKHIRGIGKSIREKFDWVEMTTPIFLIMDNAGGHGTTDKKDEYELILLEEFNIIVDWQVPNSPETNMLDLGAWMAIQHKVEQIHKTLVMQNDVLSRSVLDAFESLDCVVLTNIHKRWLKVLDLILEGNGDNTMVEDYRGKKEILLTHAHELSNNEEQEGIEGEDEASDEEYVSDDDTDNHYESYDDDCDSIEDD